jgi:hypothetical protein
LEHNVQTQKHLVPPLPEAAQTRKVNHLIRDQRCQTQQHNPVEQEFRQRETQMSQHAIPCSHHAEKVQERFQTHQLPYSSMQDIQTLVRISRQPFYRLVLRGEEVEEREVCDEDDSAAVGKDEEVHEGEWHAVQVVKDVEGYPSDDK